MEPAFPKAEVHKTFHQAYKIFYACILQHMVDSEIGKRIQSTVAANVDFFSQRGFCSSGSAHRRNLFGYALFMLLKGINWTETEVVNIST